MGRILTVIPPPPARERLGRATTGHKDGGEDGADNGGDDQMIPLPGWIVKVGRHSWWWRHDALRVAGSVTTHD